MHVEKKILSSSVATAYWCPLIPVTIRAGSKGCDSNLPASYHHGLAARVVTRTCQPVTIRAGSKGCDSNLPASYH